jgi:hypothetical protein
MDVKPTVEIVIGKNSADCRVTVNGQDITASLQGFRVECQAGGLPTATLLVRKGHTQATVEAAIADVTVETVDALASS